MDLRFSVPNKFVSHYVNCESSIERWALNIVEHIQIQISLSLWHYMFRSQLMGLYEWYTGIDVGIVLLLLVFVCLLLLIHFLIRLAYNRQFGQSSNQLARATDYIQSDFPFWCNDHPLLFTLFKIKFRFSRFVISFDEVFKILRENF